MKKSMTAVSLLLLFSGAHMLYGQPLLAPEGIEFGKGDPSTDRPRIKPGTGATDFSFSLESKYADLTMGSSVLKLQTKLPRDLDHPIYNGFSFIDWGYGGGLYRSGLFGTSSVWAEDPRGVGVLGWAGVNDAAHVVTSVSTSGNTGAYLELGTYDHIGAPPGSFAFWGVNAGTHKNFLQLALPTTANSWSAFKLGGSLSVHDTDGTDLLTSANERFKLSINPAGQDSLLLKKLAVTLDEVNFTGPMTLGGYPVLTSGASSLALFGGTTSNGGILALGNSTKASSNAAVALGWYSEAKGPASFAVGDRAVAAGLGSIALGTRTNALMDGALSAGQETTASKACALAFGFSTTADGLVSIAMGRGAWAVSDDSLALGQYAYSNGEAAAAIGYHAHSHGLHSISLGAASVAFSDNSSALGCGAWAWKNGQTVVGRYSMIPTDYPRYPLPGSGFMMPQNDTTVDDNDEVFVVGGGGSDSTRRNALVVQANGNTTVTGALTTKGSAAVAGSLTVGSAAIAANASGEVIMKVPARGGISMGIYLP